jgi:histidine triad (HIT) family protein
MQDCIFCRIIKGEIPTAIVYEDSSFIAFLDIRPINKGHTLIVPKVHAETLLDLPEDVLREELVLAKRLAKVISRVTGIEAFNLFNTNGKESGQEVFHHHLHIIPRAYGDGLKMSINAVRYEEGEANSLAGLIRKGMEGR